MSVYKILKIIIILDNKKIKDYDNFIALYTIRGLMQYLYKNVFGFTLAEVLITLGIVGVIAAMTMPTLVHIYQDKQYEIAYKKAFSLASQAWGQAVNDEGIETRPSWYDAQSKVDNFNTFKSYFNIIKDCNNFNNSECWSNAGELFYGAPKEDALAFIDSSGMSWSISCQTGDCGAELYVDTNGSKRPNKFGLDRFVLYSAISEYRSGDNPATIGMPIKIISHGDVTSFDANVCPSGNQHPCFYSSWLDSGK